ncbi:retrovirus-related pol polyprotein from transposon TNT 1-94 [Tanacetum coccineum]|uniref:Retrovirus-related pol polyprotein from transposon TNT 1-94 n=1 Tax=Tanacetum coccineum TaxID=301880 RepID=A0ABQ5ITT5_9ASTR
MFEQNAGVGLEAKLVVPEANAWSLRAKRSDMDASSPVCLMSKATSTKSSLWHRRLSHLNFGTKHDLVDGPMKLKYGKYHLCSVCERGKSKKASHSPKVVPSNHFKLELLHMDLCEPMRVASINGKTYILMIVDDYSRCTWVYFLRTKDETLEIIKKFIDIFMFGSLCYPTNDRDDLGKMKSKADIGIFIGYSETSRGFQIYNRRTKKIMETIHVKFNELTTMASEYDSLKPVFQRFINDDSSTESLNIPSKEDLDNLFGPIYEEYFEKRSSESSINSTTQQVHNHEDSPSTTSIIIEEDEALSIVTTSEEQPSPISRNEADEFNQEDSTDFDGNTVFIPYDAPHFEEAKSSTTALDPSYMHEFHQVC